MVIPLLRYRGLIWRNAAAELRHRYAGTNLGIVWNVLHPLALIGVYSVVFSAIMKPHLAGIPGVSDRYAYLLYLCAGLLPWMAFAECVTRGATAFTDNAAYLKKLPLPEQVFAAQGAASATLGLLISFSILLAVALVAGLRPTVWWLLLPLPMLLLQTMGFGVGLLLGTLNVFFRDVAQLLTVAFQIVMWTAPVVYAADSLPASLRSIVRWHPIVPPIEAIRALFLYGTPPESFHWMAMAGWTLLALLAAGVVFRKLRREIRDVL